MKLGSLLALGAFAAGEALAAPPTYTIEKVAHEGDPTPGGRTISQLYGGASIDDGGRVVFYAIDSGSTQVLFLWDGVNLSSGVAEGDVAPDTGGALVLSPARAQLAAPDLLSYAAIYDARGSPVGAFLRHGGSDSALLLPGATAPGGGTVTEVDWTHDVNEAGTVAFAGSVDSGGGALAAHFVGIAGAVSEAFREGDSTPIGGVFSGVQSFQETALAADGSLAFAANVAGGSAPSGLFRWQTGSVTALVKAGDVIPANAGTIQGFGLWAGSNEQGDIAFNADVLLPGAPFATEGVYVLASGSIRKVIHRDDAVSATSPTLTFQGLLGSTPPDLSGNGVTAFTALLEDPSFNPHAALLAEHGGVANAVVLNGDSAPGVTSAVFSDFSDARINSSGVIVFTASTSAGVGIFVAMPKTAVALPVFGKLAFVLIAGALALSGAGYSRRLSLAGRPG